MGGKCKIESDLSNYATKADLKSVAGVNTSNFAKNSDLASLKSDIDKLDIDKLETALVDFSKLSDVVKNVAKKIVYDELIKTVNAIQTTNSSNLIKIADHSWNSKGNTWSWSW